MPFWNLRKNHLRRGFSLQELLVVITIIGILAGIVVVTLNSAKGKARDARRMHDLNEIATALVMYHSKTGKWIQSTLAEVNAGTAECGGRGAGDMGMGSGWFNYVSENLTYPIISGTPKSMAKCLMDAGFMSTEVIDPTGDVRSTVTDPGHAYMKYNMPTSCSQDGLYHVYLFARLESRPGGTGTFADNADINALPSNSTCESATQYHKFDTKYGMNYVLQVQ